VNDNPNATPEFDINLITANTLPPTILAAFSINRLNGTFRGNVTLRSNDPDDDPILNPNYLSSDIDKQVLANALNKTLQVVQNIGGMVVVDDPCAAPGSNCSNELATLNTYILSGAGNVGYHASGTAAICNNVTDPYTLHAKGTRGLYVLDASIFPYTPVANSQSTTYAVAERGIRLIIDHIRRTNLIVC